MSDSSSPDDLTADEVHELDRYRSYRLSDIEGTLRSLARRPELVTAHCNGDQGQLLTAVLDVDARRNTLILDASSDEMLNRLAVRADWLLCVAKQDGVDVRFECGPLEMIEFEGRPALRAALPEWVLRLQRREFFRVPTLISQPAICTAYEAEERRGIEYTISDMSLGGVGLADEKEQRPVKVGDVWAGCQIDLPGFGRFTVDLEVRNIVQCPRAGGRGGGQRIGLAYRNLSPSDEAVVQRYINHLQLRGRSGK